MAELCVPGILFCSLTLYRWVSIGPLVATGYAVAGFDRSRDTWQSHISLLKFCSSASCLCCQKAGSPAAAAFTVATTSSSAKAFGLHWHPVWASSPLPMVLGVFAVFLLLFLSQQSCHQISLPLCLITLPWDITCSTQPPCWRDQLVPGLSFF